MSDIFDSDDGEEEATEQVFGVDDDEGEALVTDVLHDEIVHNNSAGKPKSNEFQSVTEFSKGLPKSSELRSVLKDEVLMRGAEPGCSSGSVKDGFIVCSWLLETAGRSRSKFISS